MMAFEGVEVSNVICLMKIPLPPTPLSSPYTTKTSPVVGSTAA